MRKVNIITDCTSDLTPELKEKYGIREFPLIINIGDKSYKGGVDIDTKMLFKLIDETGEMPHTASVPPAYFAELVKEYPADEDVIYMGISGGISGTFNNARLATEECPNFYPIDSANLSTGIGLLLLKAAKFRDQGMSAQEIVDEIEKIKPRVRTQFAIDTLDYLHKGGRCSGTARLFGTLLKIKPIVKVVDGKMVVAKKPIGAYKKACDTLLEMFDADIDNIDPDFVFVTHPDAHSDAIYLMDELKKRNVQIDNLVETNASSVIAAHCGPRTIGILYILKK